MPFQNSPANRNAELTSWVIFHQKFALIGTHTSASHPVLKLVQCLHTNERIIVFMNHFKSSNLSLIDKLVVFLFILKMLGLLFVNTDFSVTRAGDDCLKSLNK